MDIFSRVFNPKFFFLWHWMCVSSPFSSSTSRFLLLVARLHGKTPKMSPPAPLMRSLALEYFLGHQEHTHSVGCALFGLCVCIEHWVKLQHAQHGAQTWWHTLYPMFSTHRNVCVVCFAWFWCHFLKFTPSLHLRRSSHHCLNQHNFRNNSVLCVCIIEPYIVCIVKREVAYASVIL